RTHDRVDGDEVGVVLPLRAAGAVVDLADVPGGRLEEVAAAVLPRLVAAGVAGADDGLQALKGVGGEVPVSAVLLGPGGELSPPALEQGVQDGVAGADPVQLGQLLVLVLADLHTGRPYPVALPVRRRPACRGANQVALTKS